MAASDYKICPALTDIYISKVSKKNPNLMLSDRRVISENEILMIIDWYMDHKETEALYFKSAAQEGKIIKIEVMDESQGECEGLEE